jgi:hypothetical protein
VANLNKLKVLFIGSEISVLAARKEGSNPKVPFGLLPLETKN